MNTDRSSVLKVRQLAAATLLLFSFTLRFAIAATGGDPEYFPIFRFSPNGEYVLSQDRSGITVLTVQPFAVRFRLPAQDARFVGFTPDSLNLVFVSGGFDDHVERWRLADQTRVEFAKVSLSECQSAGLSPDGHVIVCVDKKGTLTMTDVASGNTFLNEKNFGKQRYAFIGDTIDTIPIGEPGSAWIWFSTDGRFALISAGLRSAGFDLRARTSLRLEGSLKHIRLKNKTFLSSDHVLISDFSHSKHGVAPAEVVAFPSGKLITRSRVPRGPIYTAADANFILVRPFGGSSRAAAADLLTGALIISNTPPLDVLGNRYLAEPNPGEIGLYESGKGLQASVFLPKSEGVKADTPRRDQSPLR